MSNSGFGFWLVSHSTLQCNCLHTDSSFLKNTHRIFYLCLGRCHMAPMKNARKDLKASKCERANKPSGMYHARRNQRCFCGGGTAKPCPMAQSAGFPKQRQHMLPVMPRLCNCTQLCNSKIAVPPFVLYVRLKIIP